MKTELGLNITHYHKLKIDKPISILSSKKYYFSKQSNCRQNPIFIVKGKENMHFIMSGSNLTFTPQ